MEQTTQLQRALKRIGYTIEACSSHTSTYYPENILIDKPHDQSSRWTGAHQGSSQTFKHPPWILLKLNTVAVLPFIRQYYFRKIPQTYDNPHPLNCPSGHLVLTLQAHPCNLKEFKICIGTKRHQTFEVLHAGLKNNSDSETFTVKYSISPGLPIPCRYVKIVPISAHGQNFNTSIWFVALEGLTDPKKVDEVNVEFQKFQEIRALRMVCSHLRRHNLPYKALLRETGVSLEHPTVTILHDVVVGHGNFDDAEELMAHILRDDTIVDSYTRSAPLSMRWNPISLSYIDKSPVSVPSSRSGHQMCIDHINGHIYLFGGWDGNRNLSDLWIYEVSEARWGCISEDVTQEGGPCGRSCHRMVFDPTSSSLYVLGRLPRAPSSDPPASDTLLSDFWRYSLVPFKHGSWQSITTDTRHDGGPDLLYDHGMAIDTTRRVLYVFGGKIIDSETIQKPDILIKYSGLYTYDLSGGVWSCIFADQTASEITGTMQPCIPGRSGHTMIFDPASDCLYVFAGERQHRSTEYLVDIWKYSPVSKAASEIIVDTSLYGGPSPGLAARIIADFQEGEVYFLPGLRGDLDSALLIQPRLWAYRINNPRWIQVEHQASNEGTGPHQSVLPPQRYGHQIAYDHSTKTAFLFGGTAADDKNHRFDDFWSAAIHRPSETELLRKAKFRIRRERFIEKCRTGSQIQALGYLQTSVASVVDHDDHEEGEMFRSLLQHLLSMSPETPSEDATVSLMSSPDRCSTVMRLDSPDRSQLIDISASPSQPEQDIIEDDQVASISDPGSPDLEPSSSAPESIAHRPNSLPISEAFVSSPSPEPNQLIARAMGSSFPPPPSPAGDFDGSFANISPVWLPQSRRTDSHELDMHREFRTISSPYHSSPPPPAPAMQYRSLPSSMSRSISNVTDVGSRLFVEAELPKELAVLSNLDVPGVFAGRRRLFDELLEFIAPHAKEPTPGLADLLYEDMLHGTG